MGSIAGKAFVAMMFSAVLVTAAAADDGGLGFVAGDSVKSLLARQQGKPVTLRLGSGEELSGKVAAVGDHLVHLAELSGREFFDAAVPLDGIAAVIVRSRGR